MKAANRSNYESTKPTNQQTNHSIDQANRTNQPGNQTKSTKPTQNTRVFLWIFPAKFIPRFSARFAIIPCGSAISVKSRARTKTPPAQTTTSRFRATENCKSRFCTTTSCGGHIPCNVYPVVPGWLNPAGYRPGVGKASPGMPREATTSQSERADQTNQAIIAMQPNRTAPNRDQTNTLLPGWAPNMESTNRRGRGPEFAKEVHIRSSRAAGDPSGRRSNFSMPWKIEFVHTQQIR